MKRITLFLFVVLGMLAFAMPSQALNKHILVGYWHNFTNGAANGLKLSQVDDSWDVINLSFAEPTSSTSGILQYNPTSDGIYSSAAEFKADVKAVQAKGKKVVLSIGGANGQVRLETTEARDNFIRTAEEIIDAYGLDGLDIDFEGHSLSFQDGDLDLANPTTPVIVNLIYALKSIVNHYGSDFLLTFAPETFFVQQGYSFYYPTAWGCDERAGAFLPVLYALRDRLDWLQVQYYNSGLITSPEGGQNCYTEDFLVNLANMLLTGFPIAQAAKQLTGPTSFPALKPSQVVLGVPSVSGSAGGTYSTDVIKSAFNKLRNKGFSDLRGIMTWSVNWDVAGSKAFSAPIRTYLDDLNSGNSGSTDNGNSGNENNNSDENSNNNSGNGNSGNETTGTGDCDDVPQWDPTRAYNVNGNEVNFRVQLNGKIYELNSGNWAPVGAGPESAWSYMWTYIGDCGSGSGNQGGNNQGGNEGGNSGNNDDATNTDHQMVGGLKKHLMIGYWHNFRNGLTGPGEGMKLSEASTNYDFLNVSFGETAASDRATITFVLDNSIYSSDAEFIADIQKCQARGQKVNLSLGGQNGVIEISDEAGKTRFVNSVINLIEKYGFDGLDIDFEGTSAGGSYQGAFDAPTAKQQLVINGIREICDHFGKNFILTMAPETAYVQFGIGMGSAPAYLPLIYGLRDKLTVLHVQLYNTGSSSALDGKNYNPGTADYMVAMCEMMLQGFSNSGKKFPALAEDQVAIGIPTPGTGAAGSGVPESVDIVKNALQYLVTGVKPAGCSYELQKAGGYPDFRGVMTWSVNYDRQINNNLANTITAYYNEIGNPIDDGSVTSDTEAPTTPTGLAGTPSETSIQLSWNASTDNVAVRGYNVYVNGSLKTSTTATSYNVTGLTANTSYTIEVEAYDAAGNKSSKAQTTVKTNEQQQNGGNEGGNQGGNEGGNQGVSDDDYKFVVYFPNWGCYNTVHQQINVGMIPWSKVTHIHHGFWTVGDDNKVASTDDWADFGITTFGHGDGSWSNTIPMDQLLNGHFAEYKYYKSQYPNVKVMISIGGWTRGENFHTMSSTAAGRATFIQSLVDVLKKYPFIDGFDFDWEYPGVSRTERDDEYDRGCPGGPEDKENYVLLVKEMRSTFDANGLSNKLISAAVSMNPNTVAVGPDPGEYQQYMDYINIMTYDAHGAFESVTNHHAAIYPSDDDVAEGAGKKFNAMDAGKLYQSYGVPASKLIIGTPWYSRGWGGVPAGTTNGLYQTATGSYKGSWDGSVPGGQDPWFKLKTMENNGTWTKYFDEKAYVPFLYDGSNFLTYEDEKSLSERCNFVKKYGYGGIIVWEISGDDLNNGAPMTSLVYNELFVDKTIKQTHEPTGINTISSNMLSDGAFYNLNGVKVLRPQKGVYIRNGRKVVVK